MTLAESFVEAFTQVINDIDQGWNVLGFAIQVVIVPPGGGMSNTIATHVIHVDQRNREVDFLSDCRDALAERIDELNNKREVH